MYTFEDRDGASLSLRPENTASVIRAYIEHRLDQQPGIQKLYYIGPMFRRERPQKGRYRQFYQIGAEAIGSDSPAIDAEMIELSWTFSTEAGISDFELLINSVGSRESRAALQRSAARRAYGCRTAPVQRLPPPCRDESLARAGLQGAGGSAAHRQIAVDSWIIWTEKTASISGAPANFLTTGRLLIRCVRGWCAGSIITRVQHLKLRMERWARRTPSGRGPL